MKDKRIARDIALKIISDHGYSKHVGDFKDSKVTTRGEMMDHIMSTLNDPETQMVIGAKGETLFYNDKSQIFICDNKNGYNSTYFKSRTGEEYFKGDFERVAKDRADAKMPPAKIEKVDLAKAELEHSRNHRQKTAMKEVAAPGKDNVDRGNMMLKKMLSIPSTHNEKEKEIDKDKERDYTIER